MLPIWNQFKEAWNYIQSEGLTYENEEINIDECNETNMLENFLMHDNNYDTGICVAKVINILAIE